MMANFRLIYIFRKYMPEAFSTPDLVALPITTQELKAVCHAFDWLIMTIQRIGNLNG